MKQANFVLLLTGMALSLTGCNEGRPPNRKSMQLSKQISKPNENTLFEAIDLEYWVDYETSKPALAIVSFRKTSTPSTSRIGFSYNFSGERCNYFQVWVGESKRLDIPYPENDLISTGRLPVYYAVEKHNISKAILTTDEFEQLRAAIENEDYTRAKQVVTDNAEE